MKVLVLAPHHGRAGGIGRHVELVAEALRDSGCEVLVIAANAADDVPGVIAAPALAAGHDAGAVDAVLAAAGDFAPDVVHIHDGLAADVCAAMLERHPVVWSVHGNLGCMTGTRAFADGEECHRPHGPGCYAGITLRNCGHRRVPRPLTYDYGRTSRTLELLARADVRLVYSSFMRERMEANAVGACDVLTLPVELPPAVPPVPDGDPVVLFNGRVVAHKGVGVLVEALAAVPGARLVVCGTGWGTDRVAAAARRHGVADRVAFEGWCSEAELAVWRARASVVVVPSIWAEPVGLSGLEAMAAGRAVVGTRIGGIPGWLRDGETGVLVPPRDAPALAEAINGLLADPGRLARLGARGRAVAEREHAIEDHVRTLVERYRGAITARSARSAAPAVAL